MAVKIEEVFVDSRRTALARGLHEQSTGDRATVEHFGFALARDSRGREVTTIGDLGNDVAAGNWLTGEREQRLDHVHVGVRALGAEQDYRSRIGMVDEFEILD